MSIGISGKDFDKSIIFIGGCRNSVGFYSLDKNNSCFLYDANIEVKLKRVSLGKGGVRKQLLENEYEDLMYFMIEVNLLTNRMEFVGNAFENVDNNWFDISNIPKPYRIGLTLWGESSNAIGIGIVNLSVCMGMNGQ